jgi:hypothetical protein
VIWVTVAARALRHGARTGVGWTALVLREKIMLTDTNELSLHELESTEINLEQLEAVSGGLLATTLSNLANMRHEMLKTVANNLRA